MHFVDISRDDLLNYLSQQIDNFFPDSIRKTKRLLEQDIDQALDRFFYCINYAKMWRGTAFHPLYSDKNTIFLYYLANTIWRNRQNRNICEKLFYLNKALNGFHCLYDTELPDVFLVGHSIGIVLVKMNYTI